MLNNCNCVDDENSISITKENVVFQQKQNSTSLFSVNLGIFSKSYLKTTD